MGTIQIDGSTPKLTIGNATAEDATILYDGNAKDFYISLDDSADKLVIGEGSTVGTNSILTITDDTVTLGDGAAVDTKIVFDGNAQDFYIALDDSADDLLIGLGSTVGTTPAIAIDENLKVNIPVTTASTSASTGSLTTGGGAGIGADLYVGDDVYLITDSAVLGFGADKDTTLTHTDGTGLTLNSTNKLCFNDASQYIQGASNAILDIAATDEIELTATLLDVNANLDVSGTSLLPTLGVVSAKDLGVGVHIRVSDTGGDAHSDADALVIEDNAHMGITLLTSSSTESTINFGDGDANRQGRIAYDHSNDIFNFYTSQSNNAMKIDANGIIMKPLQSAFFGNITSAVNNETGDNTRYSYIPNELADRNGDFSTSTFTAPVAGLYLATVSHNLAGITSMESGTGMIATSNRTHYWNFNPNNLANAAGSIGFSQSQIVDMDASDTLTFDIRLTGGSIVADIEDTTTMAVFLLG